MTQVVIENPIINSPFDEPTRHFRFTDEGITNEVVEGRRTSSYFVPIARPKKKGQAASLRHGVDTRPHRREQTRQRHPSPRRHCGAGGLRRRDADHRALLAYWTDPNREKETLLLPDRSPRNRHLHRRGRQEVRRCLD